MGSYTVIQPALFQATITSIIPASCSNCCDGVASGGPTVGGTPPYMLLWSPSNQTYTTATGLCAGTTYTMCVTDANGCVACDSVMVSYTVGNVEENDAGNFSTYPNPVLNELTISTTQTDNYTISVYDCLGKLILTQSIPIAANSNYILNCSEMPIGIYTMQISNVAASTRFYRRFVKQ